MSERNHYKIGAVTAMAGAVSLFVGTFLHPLEADPNDALAAFTEYASRPPLGSQPLAAAHRVDLDGVRSCALVEDNVQRGRLELGSHRRRWGWVKSIRCGGITGR